MGNKHRKNTQHGLPSGKCLSNYIEINKAIIQKTNNNKCCQGYKIKKFSYSTGGGGYKLV